MAGFKKHITTSTILGIGYGTAGYLAYDIPPASCMLAAGLCSVSGMLPDLDSDSGVPLRESITFVAAVIPMLLIDRFQHMGMSPELMVLAGGLIYIAIRFGFAEILKRGTVHRGMWHSIPAAAIAGLLAFLLCSCEDMGYRIFKTGAVVIGFMSHLVLDEWYSIEWNRRRLKKSFGTAVKFWGKRTWANILTYANLVMLLVLAVGDPFLMSHFGFHNSEIHHIAHDLIEGISRR